jgi:putative membrane protein
MQAVELISEIAPQAQGGWGYGMGPGMMGGYGYGHGFGLFWGIFMAIIIAAVVVGIIFLVRAAVTGPRHERSAPGEDEAMQILRKRFASGEISKEEFEERKNALKS